MRIRLVRKGKDSFMVLAEQGSGKGKKVTTGNKVGRAGLAAETDRLVRGLRVEHGPGPD